MAAGGPCKFHEYLVVGRGLPTEKVPEPTIYRMRIFAPNSLVARSKFWYFMKRLSNIKKMTGEILATTEIFEKKSRSIKNFGVWIRYDSRSGTHNMYKEYRELTRSHAIAACYQDLAARHRARFSNIQIIKIAEVATKDVRRAYTKQFLDSKIKFPLPHRRLRAPSKDLATTFKAQRPNTLY